MTRLKVLLELPSALTLVVMALTIATHTVALTERPDPRGHTQAATHSPRAAILGYCSSCHRSGRSGIDFDDETLQPEEMRRHRSMWEEAVRRLRTREMPPSRYPQPTDAARAAMIAWIEAVVSDASIQSAKANVRSRRLQRAEYINSVRDLFGVRFEPAADFPRDDTRWARTAETPDIAPAHLARYRAAADRILAQMSSHEDPQRTFQARLAACNCTDRIDVEKTRGLLEDFARRAYRRPAHAEEVDDLLALVESTEAAGKSFEESVKAALREMLTSKHFLCRVERLDAPVDDEQSPFALAGRLSFFLTRSTPDEDLLARAENGSLTPQLPALTQRLLRDPRSREFAVDFTSFWLGIGALESLPGCDKQLNKLLRQETELFVAEIVREDRSVLEFLDADFTFVNERLAQHYGIAGIRGDALRRVSTAGTQRGGLLTHGSFLTVTSAGRDTSPVLRGKWILENLLGAAPVRPPAGLLQAFESAPKDTGPGSFRKQVEAHRANPSCAACHLKLDGLGMPLENFDAQGAWRTRLGKYPIDPIGELPDGEVLHGPADVKTHLLKHRDVFVQALSEKLLQFALGRKLEDRDRAALQHIPPSAARNGYRLAHLIEEVVRSEPFQNAR